MEIWKVIFHYLLPLCNLLMRTRFIKVREVFWRKLRQFPLDNGLQLTNILRFVCCIYLYFPRLAFLHSSSEATETTEYSETVYQSSLQTVMSSSLFFIYLFKVYLLF